MIATLSVLTFPQLWENNQLTVHALVIPRNIDPTLPDQIAAGTPAWCDATIALKARLIPDLTQYPSILQPDQPFDLPGLAMPVNTKNIFEAIAASLGGIQSVKRLEPATSDLRTRKYLPESYRNSFNFTRPRTNDAAIDDSYHCAVKDNTPIDNSFKSSTDSLSWGKVFAYCMRQPALAERAGFIYKATFNIDPDLVKEGGWIYIDLADGCSYKAAMDANQKLVKRYAARLPKLKKDDSRSLFAAVQFPVLISTVPNMADEDDPIQPSGFDDLLIECQQYDDGFCKIVHASQPVSSDHLKETEDKELPVITDAGIRLGWDDEQLLIWMNRQMKQDEALPAGRRTDAPMGAFQYRVDVRLHSDEIPNPNPWQPLCRVRNKIDLVMGETIDVKDHESELGVTVFPAQLDARKDQPYWLPQYFAGWIGKSLVLPDVDAINIFRKTENADPDRKAKVNDIYAAAGLENISLTYGSKYDFRVRLMDTTGGGPTLDKSRIYDAPAPEGFCDFRRYVQPQTVRLRDPLPVQDDAYYTNDRVAMKRPLLGYPSVLFTGQYPNAVNDLIADVNAAMAERREVGLADPDVDSVEVLVEIKALEMDMLLRYNTDSRESYAMLYITKRTFPANLNGELEIPFTFVDAHVLNFTDSQDLGELGLTTDGDIIDDHTDIVLPTSRDVRITLRPVVANKPEYYGRNTDLPKKGKPVTLITRRASTDETSLFKSTGDVDRIRGIWLQPDTDTYLKATTGEVFVENYQPSNSSSMIERLVNAINRSIEVESKGLSLTGKPGARLQFGASRFIRHNLSPDSTNITFSTKGDLLNHWIIPITLLLNRDWTWDGAMPVSFEVYRQKKFAGVGLSDEEIDAIPWEDEELVGDIEMKQAINIQALYNPDRSQTYLCFLDSVEPNSSDPLRLPEEIMVQYRIHPLFKSLPDPVDVNPDPDLLLLLHLPITTKPAQVPRIVSAGIAQSKYVADETYSSTEPRKRFLWLEFDEPLRNPNDNYFIRMLAYSPDPLLASWESGMLRAPEEPNLPIDPEPIRIISPEHTDDKSGLNAMEEMIKADSSDVHYLVPLPPGLHAASAELFGFFTYELRVGHKKGWSTAQGRFGSALRTTGAQHPLPQLFCTVNRNEKYIIVNAPYAQTLFNGADVTSKPPRTQLWALLYAQVKRADDMAYRNILLDDQLFVLPPPQIDPQTGMQIIDINTDAIQYGITGWLNRDVERLLKQFGLPVDSKLSILTVEMLPGYDKFFSPRADIRQEREGQAAAGDITLLDFHEGMEVQLFKNSMFRATESAALLQQQKEKDLYDHMEEKFISEAQKQEKIRPLTEQLGTQRILRTSTLVPVPEVCCTV